MEGKDKFDSILNEIGFIGRTQLLYFTLICFTTFFTGSFTVIYAFTAGDLNYRCYIDGCDNNIQSTDYNPRWLQQAVPFDEDTELPEKCLMYDFAAEHITNNDSRDFCDASDFNVKYTSQCNKFVFETEEETILTEFGLMCKENKWKLTLPGTIHSSGSFFNMLMIGYISDRFGRKIVFVASAIIASTFAMAQLVAPTYWWFLVFKFLETCLGDGTYTISIVLGLELVTPEYRTVVGSIIFAIAAAGTVYLGLAAMWLLHWKLLILVVYIPNFLAITYIWLLPESVTWLQVKGRYQDIANILLKIIKWNKVEVSAETRDILENKPDTLFEKPEKKLDAEEKSSSDKVPIRELLRSRPMMLRMMSLVFCWLTNFFIFYGLSLISVSIGANKFIDFIIASAMEIPACGLVTLLSTRVGRKTILSTGFFVSGTALLIYTFVSDIYWIKMIMFMTGKLAITMSFCTIYIYTSELVPTNLRQTLIGVCAAIGRIGALTAPQAPLLESLMKNLSIYLFAGFALAGGLIAFRFPETLNSKLPDTIEEALQIGKRDDKKKSLCFC